jgi:hypothetical protein
MYDNYMYTVPSVGKVTYYLNLRVSSAQYANTVTTFSVPTTAEPPPNGATWTALTGTQRSPIIYFGAKLGILWGFNEESTDYTTGYGSTSLTSLTTNSNITPQINPSQSIVLTCNAIRNGGIAFPSNFLYSLGIMASFGALIENPAHEVIYNKALVGSHLELEIKLFDQNMNPMYLLDTNSLIVLSIINPKAHGIPWGHSWVEIGLKLGAIRAQAYLRSHLICRTIVSHLHLLHIHLYKNRYQLVSQRIHQIRHPLDFYNYFQNRKTSQSSCDHNR